MRNAWLFLLSLLLVSCSSGKLFGPTITPTPTETLIPTDTPTFTPTLTETPTATPTATATKEPEIGGTTAVILWRLGKETDVPPEFAPYLVPTTPDQWKSLDTLTMSDGTSIPWGDAVTYVDVGDPTNWPLIPGLVRGVVEFGMFQGFPEYGAIIEFPVKGGSVFYISIYFGTLTNPVYPTSRLIPGAYPAVCSGGAVCKTDQLLASIASSKFLNGQDTASLLQKLQGKMVLFLFIPIKETLPITHAIASGSLDIGEFQGATLPVPEFWYQP